MTILNLHNTINYSIYPILNITYADKISQWYYEDPDYPYTNMDFWTKKNFLCQLIEKYCCLDLISVETGEILYTIDLDSNSAGIIPNIQEPIYIMGYKRLNSNNNLNFEYKEFLEEMKNEANK